MEPAAPSVNVGDLRSADGEKLASFHEEMFTDSNKTATTAALTRISAIPVVYKLAFASCFNHN